MRTERATARNERTIAVELVDQAFQFVFRGVLAECSHHTTEHFGIDGTVRIFVVEKKGLTEFYGGQRSREGRRTRETTSLTLDLFLCEMFELEERRKRCERDLKPETTF